ncbi:hypothetical protein ACFV2D_37615 [Streptomyces capillispiralis]|uniref:hypothetical protein n=1 Tax=Streptomyces capillispiralis TaxID=68182 RepID=UPI0036A908B8
MDDDDDLLDRQEAAALSKPLLISEWIPLRNGAAKGELKDSDETSLIGNSRASASSDTRPQVAICTANRENLPSISSTLS